MKYRGRLRTGQPFPRSPGTIDFAPDVHRLPLRLFWPPEGKCSASHWDYRYTWIRDASFTSNALMRLAPEETMHSLLWMEQTRSDPEPQRTAIDVSAGTAGGSCPTHSREREGYANQTCARRQFGAGGGATGHLWRADGFVSLILNTTTATHFLRFWRTWVAPLIEWCWCHHWQKPITHLGVRGGTRLSLFRAQCVWLAH